MANSSEASRGPIIAGGLIIKNLGQTVWQGSGAPTDGTSGTGAGKIAVNGQYFDYTNGLVWTNFGTKASPKYFMNFAQKRVALTSANILAMNGAPVAILPAPAANRLIVVSSVVFTMTTTATAYANGGTVQFNYTTTSVACHTSTIPAATVTAGAGTSITELGPLVTTNGAVLTTAVALGISITNNTAAFITGTGTAVVTIAFSIVPTN